VKVGERLVVELGRHTREQAAAFGAFLQEESGGGAGSSILDLGVVLEVKSLLSELGDAAREA